MNIEPTITEAMVYFVLAVVGFGLMFLPWNDRYDPKGKDPYRYCPKDED